MHTEKEFFERFKFFQKGETPAHYFYCGIQCDEGWYDMLWELCEDLEKMEFDGKVLQIKEKFGGLRFYVNGTTDEMEKRIDKAEEDSYKICEVCGKPGKTRDTGWVKTLCDEHFERWLKKK